jgi:hypothetical protein
MTVACHRIKIPEKPIIGVMVSREPRKEKTNALQVPPPR